MLRGYGARSNSAAWTLLLLMTGVALSGCRTNTAQQNSNSAAPQNVPTQAKTEETPSERFSRLARAGAARQDLLAALIEKGDLALKDEKDVKHLRARCAYTFASLFDAGNKDLAGKLKELGGPVTSKEANELDASNDAGMRFSIAMMSSLSSSTVEDLTSFSKLTPEMELVNLRMLLDERIGGDLSYSPMQIGKNSSRYLLIFISKPSLTPKEMRDTYGQPSSENMMENSTTYGLLRFHGSDCVVFPMERGSIPRALMSDLKR